MVLAAMMIVKDEGEGYIKQPMRSKKEEVKESLTFSLDEEHKKEYLPLLQFLIQRRTMSIPKSTLSAALLHKQHYPFTLTSLPLPALQPHQLLIRTRAVAINPCDAGIQSHGLIWSEELYPLAIGSDVAGEVISSTTQRFQPGDRVIACVEKGAFAEHVVADERMCAFLPGKVKFEEGVVLPLGLSTAAVGLFHGGNMGLSVPTLEGEKGGKRQTVVVWGGSSSVGSCAVQMLVAAGYEVLAVAGGKNLGYCRDLGAKEVFPHQDGDVEGKIVRALEGEEEGFRGVFSAIMTAEVIRVCARIADRVGTSPEGKVVGTVLPPVMPFEEVIPEGVRLAYCACGVEIIPDTPLGKAMGMTGTPNDVGPAIWERWVTGALERGILRCKPDAEVVGSGLESVQLAVDRLKEGVSAKKMVVIIP